MTNIRIDDLSDIEERRLAEDSNVTFDQTKKRVQISCPYTHTENYQCPICMRLRATCPFSRIKGCNHQQPLLKTQNISMYSKGNMSTTLGERMRTQSNYESRNTKSVHFANPSQSVYVQPQRNLRTEISIPTIEEVIFVPEIHNKIIMQKTPEKSPIGSPTKRKRDKMYLNISQDVILTPSQFKDLINSFRRG